MNLREHAAKRIREHSIRMGLARDRMILKTLCDIPFSVEDEVGRVLFPVAIYCEVKRDVPDYSEN